MEDFLNEFAPVQVGVSKTEEGFYVHHPVVPEPEATTVDPKLRGDAIPRDGDTPQLDLAGDRHVNILRALRTCGVLSEEDTAVTSIYAQKVCQTILGGVNMTDEAMILTQAAVHVDSKLAQAVEAQPEAWTRLAKAARSGVMKDGTATTVGNTIRRLLLEPMQPRYKILRKRRASVSTH